MTSSTNSDTPRVIMFLASMPPMPVGGAEVQAIRLCKELRSRGVQVEVLTWGKLWQKKTDVYDGVEFTRVSGIFNAIADLPGIIKKAKKTKETRIVYNDSIEVTNAMTSKVWRGMRLRYTLVYFNLLSYLRARKNHFDILYVCMMEWPALVAVRAGKRLNKKVVIKDSTMNGIFNLLRYPDGKNKQAEVISYGNFVAMTKMIRENFLKAGIPESRISLIPNGIEISVPAVKKGWNDKVLFIGNLTQQPAKGVDILLAAWRDVIEKVPAATLHIYGDGDIGVYENYCRSLSIDNSVRFYGKQRITRDLINASDVFVLPSRREGMSNALMEAMSCAMPVVATDVSGSQDLIENGISGLIVPPANSSSLAAALIYLLLNPEEAMQMGKRGYESVAAKCDMKIVGAEYENLYRKLLTCP